ncbi:methyltransferase domain-containing protein [Roseomonas terrae]|uniref:Methyltransferase domain-containing protein n=1 Tax=Neoroseomonas terrae TaxID=424799 RepID=A0ABS5EGZ8_9PROT|nr:class I SAM-dependent methyltransferase [Neoroseomonas terrae]MBR0650301.1 methyltransferase domain-containing protein [Neoroseomonas terrae]
MNDAKSRYGAADVRYVTAFQPEASPARLHFALALAETHWEPADRERLTVLDIGCGRGVTARMLAAANPGWDVVGIDLQPVHIVEAREAAAAAGIDNVRFLEMDLTEFDEAGFAAQLPEADVVILWGVWTWVPDGARDGIVRLLKSRVKAGGVVLVGYNALPGFSDAVVMQRLIEEGARQMPGEPHERAMAAFEAVEAMREAGAYSLPNEHVLGHMLNNARRSPAYLVHEWLTTFWRPAFHVDLAKALAPARLEFGGSANPSRSMPSLQLTPAQRAVVENAPAGIHRETLLDMFLQRRFRADIFVRGRRPAGPRALADIPVALGMAPELIDTSVTTASGEATLKDEHEAVLAQALAHGPRTIGELASLPGLGDLSLLEIAVMLVESSAAHPLWRPTVRDPAIAARAARANAALLDNHTREGGSSGASLGIVAPVLGSAVAASPSDLAVIVELQRGVPPEPRTLAAAVVAPGLPPEVMENATAAIERLLAIRLPAWRGLGLV